MKRKMLVAVILVAIMMLSLASGVYAVQLMNGTDTFSHSSGTATLFGDLHTASVVINKVTYTYACNSYCSRDKGTFGITSIWARATGEPPVEAATGSNQCTSYGKLGSSAHGAESAIDEAYVSLFDPR